MDQKTHKKITKKLLGKSYPQVDQFLDLAWWINPKEHRDLWAHDPRLALYLYLLGKKELAKAVSVHLLLDKISSGENKEIFKSLLSNL